MAGGVLAAAAIAVGIVLGVTAASYKAGPALGLKLSGIELDPAIVAFIAALASPWEPSVLGLLMVVAVVAPSLVALSALKGRFAMLLGVAFASGVLMTGAAVWVTVSRAIDGYSLALVTLLDAGNRAVAADAARAVAFAHLADGPRNFERYTVGWLHVTTGPKRVQITTPTGPTCDLVLDGIIGRTAVVPPAYLDSISIDGELLPEEEWIAFLAPLVLANTHVPPQVVPSCRRANRDEAIEVVVTLR